MNKLILPLLPLLCFSSCLHFVHIKPAKTVSEHQLDMTTMPGARFYDSMSACENVYPEPSTNKVYVTSLDGYIYLLDGERTDALSMIASLNTGGYALGIDRGSDGVLYAAICKYTSAKEWSAKGGGIARIDPGLKSFEMLSDEYPSINGLAFDNEGRGYFATSNFSFISPRGSIMRFSLNADGTLDKPEALTQNMGLANGLFYYPAHKKVYYSDTLESCGIIKSGKNGYGIIYRKAAFKEAFDDLCVDSAGRLWMTDPIRRTLKVYDPDNDRLVRFMITGFGQASSCRIRNENGEEIIYITELAAPKRTKGKPFNGRGLLRVPLKSFPQI